jgi:hypothetical protein
VAYQTLSGYSGMFGGIGVEYTYKQWGALRAGYHAADEKHVSSSYASVGCGIMFHGFGLDFAYMLANGDAPIRQTMVISLGYLLK